MPLVNKSKPTKGNVSVEKTKDGARIIITNNKGIGFYFEGGGKQPSHGNKKGEIKGGAGVVIKFGSVGKKK
jgi:hypothetical protein